MKTSYLVGFLVLLTLCSGATWLIAGYPQLEPVTIILGSIIALLEVGKISKINKFAGFLIGILGIGFFIFGINQALDNSASNASNTLDTTPSTSLVSEGSISPIETITAVPVPTETESKITDSINSVEIGGDMSGGTIVQSDGDVNIEQPMPSPTPLPVCTIVIADYYRERGMCTGVYQTTETFAVTPLDCLPHGATVIVDSILPAFPNHMYHVVSWEYETTNPIFVETISPNSPAEAAGLQVGDQIVSFDGIAIEDIPNMREYSEKRSDQSITIGIERDGETLELMAEPRETPPDGEGPIGFTYNGGLISGQGTSGYVAVSTVSCP